jgi:putative inorganic carbon (HCO3(-)) transporter
MTTNTVPNIVPNNLPNEPQLTTKAGALAWGLVGLSLAALLVVSITELNRLAILLMVTAPLLTLVMVNVEFGVYLLLGYSSVLGFLIRMMPPTNSGPIGVALDGLLVIMGLRLLFDLARRRDWKIFASPLTTPVIVFFLFQVIEVFNPAAPSIMYGLWGLRVTLRIISFFLVLYYFRETRAIKRLMGFWLALMALVGAYGIFQHHHGLLWQEMNWLLTEGNAQTHIVNGYVRVFSTVGDASTYGFLMVISTLMMISLAVTAKPMQQFLLALGTLPMLYGMVCSFSRGPLIALAFGVGVMILASRNWRLGVGVGAIAAIGIVLLIASGSTEKLERMSTASNPLEDASFMVRVGYITQYVPEIAKRPFGFGINTSGGNSTKISGQQSVRGTVVGVPTDCYYFKVALEMGWVGLAIFLWLHALAMIETYKVYKRTNETYLRAVALGLFGILCCLFVGSFSNDLHAQKPISEFFWVALGLAMLIGQRQAQASLVVPRMRLPQKPLGLSAGQAAFRQTP